MFLPFGGLMIYLSPFFNIFLQRCDVLNILPSFVQFPYALLILLMWGGDYGGSQPKLNHSSLQMRQNHSTLNPFKSQTHRNPTKLVMGLQTLTR